MKGSIYVFYTHTTVTVSEGQEETRNVSCLQGAGWLELRQRETFPCVPSCAFEFVPGGCVIYFLVMNLCTHGQSLEGHGRHWEEDRGGKPACFPLTILLHSGICYPGHLWHILSAQGRELTPKGDFPEELLGVRMSLLLPTWT